MQIGPDAELPFDPQSYRVARLDELAGNIPIDHRLVRERRANRRLTQQQAADTAELTQNRWQQIEKPRGTKIPSVKAGNLEGIAEALEMPPEVLVELPVNAVALMGARTLLGLTQQELAERCSVSLSEIQHFEDASTELEPKAFWSTIKTVASELGVQPTVLLIPRHTDPDDSPPGPGRERYKSPDGTYFSLNLRDSLMLRRLLESIPSYVPEDTESRATGRLIGVVGVHGKTCFVAPWLAQVSRPLRDATAAIGAGGLTLRDTTKFVEAFEALVEAARPSESLDQGERPVRRPVRESARIVDVGRIEVNSETDAEFEARLAPAGVSVQGRLGDREIQPGDLAFALLRQRSDRGSEDSGHTSNQERSTESDCAYAFETQFPIEVRGTVVSGSLSDEIGQPAETFVLDTDARTANREAGWEYRSAFVEETGWHRNRETVANGDGRARIRDVIHAAEMAEAFFEEVRASRTVEFASRRMQRFFTLRSQTAHFSQVEIVPRAEVDCPTWLSPRIETARGVRSQDRMYCRGLVREALLYLTLTDNDNDTDSVSRAHGLESGSLLEMESGLPMRGADAGASGPLYEVLTEPTEIYSSEVRGANGSTIRDLQRARYEDRANDVGGVCAVREDSRHDAGGMGEVETITVVGESAAPGPSGTHSAPPAIRVATDAAFDPVTIIKAVEAAIALLDIEERAAVLLTCAREEGLHLLADCDKNRVDAAAAARGWMYVAQRVACELGRVLAVDAAPATAGDLRSPDCVAEFVIDPVLAGFASLNHSDEGSGRPN